MSCSIPRARRTSSGSRDFRAIAINRLRSALGARFTILMLGYPLSAEVDWSLLPDRLWMPEFPFRDLQIGTAI
jgi:hypothetical protein